MPEADAYRSWRECADAVTAVVKDRSIPSWQKARQVGAAFTPVQLDGLRSKHRHRIFKALKGVNTILGKYTIQDWNDYQQINEADLQAIIAIFRSLKPPK